MSPGDPRALADFVKTQARAAGFQLAGITTADPPAHHAVYQAWVRAGRHGQMSYLGTPRAMAARREPRDLLPECRSILVVAASYAPEQPVSSTPAPHVAAYAQGDDYHAVFKARLQSLMAQIQSHLAQPFPYRIYVDTGPILERELAQRAGLGWIGKNTCLINPQAGSYFLLGVVLLGLELEPDRAFVADRCGACTRCIQACPTGCILPDRTLDASRCISYLTIELKGPVADGLRPATDGWIFGCDICQDVCPWNMRFSQPTGDPAFRPRAFIESTSLDGWLRIDRPTYTEALRGSPLKRTKLGGLKRNASLAAGQAGHDDLAPGLISALSEDDPMVREHAAWALGRIHGASAQAGLRARLRVETDPTVLSALHEALGRQASG